MANTIDSRFVDINYQNKLENSDGSKLIKKISKNNLDLDEKLNHLFTKKYKINKPAQYSHIFSKPKRLVDKNFIIIAKLNTENYPRLGLAISKKSIKLSVQRNRIKRLIREYFRNEVIPCDAPIDFVVMAKKNIQNNDNKSLTLSLSINFNKLINQLS
jgi:ribonuclease P protein component